MGLVGYSVHWVGTEVEQSASRILPARGLTAGAEIGERKAESVPWGLRPRDWGSLSGKPVTHLFFCLVPAGDVSPGSGAGFSGFGQQSGSLRLQCPVSGGRGGATCQQNSHLLAGCWGDMRSGKAGNVSSRDSIAQILYKTPFFLFSSFFFCSSQLEIMKTCLCEGLCSSPVFCK